jgi:hypothetical protein
VYDEAAGVYVHPEKLSPEAFSQKFKLSWADPLLKYHPEYCKLLNYEALSKSHEWDRRFEKVDTYAEAKSLGYLNPTGNTSSVFTRFDGVGTKDRDTLAILYDSTSNHYKDSLEKNIKKFRYNNNNVSDALTGETGMSMWGVATAMVMCKGNDNACYLQWGKTVNAFDSTAMCSADLDMAWRAFRQMYLDVKRKLIYHRISNICSGQATASALFTAGHQPHFSDADEMGQLNNIDNSGDTAAARIKQNAYFTSNCQAFATTWWKQLQSCNLSSTDSARIIPQLILVCKEGADVEHPFGSSTVKPSSTNQYKSFM